MGQGRRMSFSFLVAFGIWTFSRLSGDDSVAPDRDPNPFVLRLEIGPPLGFLFLVLALM